MNIQQVPNLGLKKARIFAVLQLIAKRKKNEACKMGRLVAYEGEKNAKHHLNQIKWCMCMGKLNALANGGNTGVTE